MTRPWWMALAVIGCALIAGATLALLTRSSARIQTRGVVAQVGHSITYLVDDSYYPSHPLNEMMGNLFAKEWNPADDGLTWAKSVKDGHHQGIASLVYNNASGGTEQMDAVALPFAISFHVHGEAFLHISAQNKLDDHGRISVRIYVDGEPVRDATSTGSYVIATASGRLP